jgi:rfaE bifunctional protein nucleotidyltransferase chain/domain
MEQIINTNQLNLIEKCEEIVLVGGCFDILHLGHITFLKKAKEMGETLVVLLESDETIKKLKGKDRPINNQKNRAEMLSQLKMVDWIIELPDMKNGSDYDDLIEKIKPKIIAITEGDKKIDIKRKQAEMIGARLVEVTKEIPFCSTSGIIARIY